MNSLLLEKLSNITEEERQILSGKTSIQKDIYSVHKTGFTINSEKLLEKNSLINVRPHTRFIDFPHHKHDYIEMMYVCKGSIEHKINEETIILKEGEILLLNTFSYHEIKQAGENDIAINFIIHPSFFESNFNNILGNNPIRLFLYNLLSNKEMQGEYFYFQVSEIFEIQNLIENMIFSLINKSNQNIMINQMSMNLLFMYFAENISRIYMLKDKLHQDILVDAVLDYISLNYRNAELTEIAQILNQSLSVLSRLIKKQTGKTFKDLLMSLRFYKAIELLETTNLTVDSIVEAVGYENNSYFHRTFKMKYNMTPLKYRQKHKK